MPEFHKRVIGSALALWFLFAVSVSIFLYEVERDINTRGSVVSWDCKPATGAYATEAGRRLWPDQEVCQRLFLPINWYVASGVVSVAVVIAVVGLARIWSPKR